MRYQNHAPQLKYYRNQPENNFYNRGMSNNIIGNHGFAQSDHTGAIANSIVVTGNSKDFSGVVVNSIISPSLSGSNSIIGNTGIAIGGGGSSAFGGGVRNVSPFL